MVLPRLAPGGVSSLSPGRETGAVHVAMIGQPGFAVVAANWRVDEHSVRPRATKGCCPSMFCGLQAGQDRGCDPALTSAVPVTGTPSWATVAIVPVSAAARAGSRQHPRGRPGGFTDGGFWTVSALVASADFRAGRPAQPKFTQARH